AREKGKYFMDGLKKIHNPEIKEVRGRGLLIGVEFYGDAFDYVKACIHEGVLCKETHDHTIRFAPPIPVSYEELDDALARITKAIGR
ncbi:MAG: aminotransferase class III-fold pyridoxal phosphate-dependent enzyme, partial [Oscillospiraceae bacterium]|nr:aminotransferase class III-fold pyridoxal phosphate-dependent enzyme [Oscillospiraceae bacterium]